MPKNINSAFRVREILNQGRNKSNTEKVYDVWSQIFKITENDSNKKIFEITRCLNQIHDEVENILFEMKRTDFSEDLYSAHIKRVNDVIAVQTMMNNWESQKSQITGEMILVLGFCSEILPNEEILIEEIEFNEILDNVSKLEKLLDSNNLPFSLKKILSRNIEKIKEAISSYKIIGINALTEVTNSAIGEIIAKDVIFEEAKETEEIGLIIKIWSLIKNISDKVVRTDNVITAGANSVERGIKMLEYVEKIFQ